MRAQKYKREGAEFMATCEEGKEEYRDYLSTLGLINRHFILRSVARTDTNLFAQAAVRAPRRRNHSFGGNIRVVGEVRHGDLITGEEGSPANHAPGTGEIQLRGTRRSRSKAK